MRLDVQREIVIGEKIELNVVELKGNPVLETQFIQYDAELRAQDLRECGIDKFDFTRCEEFDEEYIDGYRNFRSVRIFHLAADEKIKLNTGDEISARMVSAHIARNKTKDNRRKIHITLSHARRVYKWTRQYAMDLPALIMRLYCGAKEVKQKIIPIAYKKGIQIINGRAYPMIAETLPSGSIMSVIADHTRPSMTTGDYRLAERQKGRTMKDIDKDFLRVPPHDRLVPTRDRKFFAAAGVRI